MGPFVTFSYICWTFSQPCQLSVRPWDLSSTSVNFLCIRATICQFSVGQQGLPTTSVHFPYISETFCQHSIRARDLPSTSINILSVRGKYFVWKLDLPLNFRQVSVWLRDLPQLFVHQQDLQSSSVNIPCSHKLSSTCVNFPCIRGTFRQCFVQMRYHPSTFHLSGDVPSTSVNFPCIRGTFRQCFVQMRYHPSTFHLSGDVPSTSVNFPCIRGTIHQSFVCQRNIVSSSVNILGGRVTFRLLPSTSCASVRPSFLLAFHVAAGLLSTFLASVGCSISLGQLSVHQRGLPSTSINFLSTRCSFCQVLSTLC